jgi:hypothetical protein
MAKIVLCSGIQSEEIRVKEAFKPFVSTLSRLLLLKAVGKTTCPTSIIKPEQIAPLDSHSNSNSITGCLMGVAMKEG